MNRVSDWCSSNLPVNCLSITTQSGVVSFDSALDESLNFLCELGMSRKLLTEQKDTISTLKLALAEA